MLTTVCRGIVKGNIIILEQDTALPEGTEVLVTPLSALAGSPQALLSAMKAKPHLKPEDVDEFEKLIEAGKRPVSFRTPFAKKRGRGKP